MTAVKYSGATLRRTIAKVCSLIDERVQVLGGIALSEAELRFELVSCLLGSRVRAESANAAVERLRSVGLLSDERWGRMDSSFEVEVREVLAGRWNGSTTSAYRFPALRARQLTQLRSILNERPLRSYLGISDNAGEIRKYLVRDLPGVGPKQASMFLRNIGASFDIAILDAHVLRFLKLVEVLPDATSVSALDRYERTEVKAREFAESVGRKVGQLDWAIWITMRAAREALP